jgi:hypothetical protein
MGNGSALSSPPKGHIWQYCQTPTGWLFARRPCRVEKNVQNGKFAFDNCAPQEDTVPLLEAEMYCT